jgi:putative membrane protein
MKLITRLLLVAFSLLLVSRFVPGVTIDGLYAALIAAVILGLLNLIVRPILFVLTFPITVITIGLFTLVINASLFWFAASFVDGFSVSGFWPALFGSLVVTIISTIGNRYLD